MDLEAKGICAIIKACHSANVSQLKFGDLEVTFGSEPSVNNVPHATPYDNAGEQEPLGSGPVSMELSTEQKQIMEEAGLTEMMVLDPEGWEQHNIDRLVHQNRSLDGRS